MEKIGLGASTTAFPSFEATNIEPSTPTKVPKTPKHLPLTQNQHKHREDAQKSLNLLFYANASNPTMFHALRSITFQQSTPTE